MLLAITVICWSLYHCFAKLSTNTLPAPAVQLILSICYAASIPLYLAILNKTGQSVKWNSTGTMWAILAWISTAIGTLTYTYALEKTNVSTAVIIATSYPILTVFFAIAFLGEAFSWSKLLGLAFVFGGVVLTVRK